MFQILKLWSEFWNYGPIIRMGTHFTSATITMYWIRVHKMRIHSVLLKSCQYSENNCCVSYIKCVFNKQWCVLAHSRGCVWETAINVNHRITIRCFVPFSSKKFCIPIHTGYDCAVLLLQAIACYRCSGHNIIRCYYKAT